MIHSPHLRATVDLANYVEVGVRPFDQAYSLLKGFVDYVHVKDAQRLADGACKVVAAGQGDGQVAEMLAGLAQEPREIFLSIDPRCAQAHETEKVSDGRCCGQAMEAVKTILGQIGAAQAGITLPAP